MPGANETSKTPATQAEQLNDVGRMLREAIAAALPTAFEQFVTISMPGRIIDTTPGGEFVRSSKPSSGELHKIRVNEAKLVDSMIPLDTMMLGPTGKSVSRSYLSALDYLIPNETEVAVPQATSKEDKEPPTKYGLAMKYLRRPISAPGGPTKTVVDIYVEKQAKYTEAQARWDAIQDQNAVDMENRADEMTAEEMELRTTRMRTAKFELQARWMDWVVNGDKILVDHNFAVVDISTVMARIEASKEAARGANILDLVDGTQWAQVTLQPKNWAALCRDKAEEWATRNPVSPTLIQREIDRLTMLLAAYQGFNDWNETKGTGSITEIPEIPESGTYSSEVYLEVYRAQEKLRIARDKQKTPEPAESGETSSSSSAAPTAQEIGELERGLNKAIEAVNKMIEENMKKEKANVNVLETTSSKGAKKSIAATVASLEHQISALKDRLNESTQSTRNGISPHLKFEKVKNDDGSESDKWRPVPASDTDTEGNKHLLNGATNPNKKPDPWTTVSFDSEKRMDSKSTSASTLGGGVNAKFGGFLGSVEASTRFSESNKKFQAKMSTSKVTGSFSAILVQITRPWLHSELFHDYEIDTPSSAKLSPGAVQLKEWLHERNDIKLAEYGVFPTYPTAFIVAANTELEIACGNSDAEEFLKSSSTDSSVSVSYGPWAASASANLKTESSSSNSRMEASATGMKISFQAPQIIGWVSEIIPELPRSKEAKGQGGLTGAPIKLFRQTH